MGEVDNSLIPRNLRTARIEARMRALKGKALARDLPKYYNPILAKVVVILLDCSSSMAGSKLSFAINGAEEFARRVIKEGWRVGLVQFETEARVSVETTTDIAQFTALKAKLQARGSTNMTAAINLGVSCLKSEGGQKVLYLISDGNPVTPDTREAAISATQTARRMNVKIMTLGTDDADTAFLSEITGDRSKVEMIQAESMQDAVAGMARLLLTNSSF